MKDDDLENHPGSPVIKIGPGVFRSKKGVPVGPTGAHKPLGTPAEPGEPRQRSSRIISELEKKQNVRSRVVERKLRHTRALQLRQAGLNWSQIAEQCGYSSHSAARKAVESQLREYRDRSVADLMVLEDSRLDALQMTLWAAATNPDVPLGARLQAIDRVLKVMDQRAKYHGLYAAANSPQPEVSQSARTEIRERILAKLQIIEERRTTFPAPNDQVGGQPLLDEPGVLQAIADAESIEGAVVRRDDPNSPATEPR